MKNLNHKSKIKKTRVFAFIDATNIIYGASNSGWRMDFQKLIAYLKNRFNCTKIFYYAGVDNENKKQLRFYKKLQEFGYLLRLVPVKKFKDGKKKADVDSRMTFEIMKYFSLYRNAVILTGDGDYFWVIEYLKAKKQQIWLMGFRKSTAHELKQLVKERFDDLSRLKSLLSFSKKNEADALKGSASRDYEKSLTNIKKKVKK